MSLTSSSLGVRDLQVDYRNRGKRTTVVRGVNFEIGSGETLGVVGESGSGKTTIARAILNLVPITSGTITTPDWELTKSQRPGRREIARYVQCVFQDPHTSLNPALKVGSTLAEPFRAARGGTAAEARDRAGDLLEKVGLDRSAADRFPASFSGGQRQRIAIARALMSSPKLIICDEAVSALDLSIQAQVLNLLRSLQREFNLSYLFITHDLDVVRYISHRVVVIYRGRVMEYGPAEDVARDPRHPYTQALLAAAPGHVSGYRRARPDSGAATSGCPFAPRCKFAVERCSDQVPELRALDDGRAAACLRLDEVRALNVSAQTAETCAVRGEEGVPSRMSTAEDPK